MRKSTLTLILFAVLSTYSFAQQDDTMARLDENINNVEKIVDEKSDITGTFSNTGKWEIMVDDAKVKFDSKPVKEIKNPDMQELIQAGLKYVQKDKSKYACYRYRIVASVEGKQTMYLYECKF